MNASHKELLKYVIAGVFAVGTDYGVYRILLLLALSHSPAKAVSYVCGMVVAFVLNRYWTFKSKNEIHTDTFKFILLYTGSLVANVITNKGVLLIFPTYIGGAFIIATGLSIVINYVGQKYWVFTVWQ